MGISRATADKWLARYRAAGVAGLADRSSRPYRSPRRTPPAVKAAVEPTWGTGSSGALRWRLVALRVPPADGTATARRAAGGSLPAGRLPAEWPPAEPEPTDYWPSNLLRTSR